MTFYSQKSIRNVICHPFDSVMQRRCIAQAPPMTHVVMHDIFHARNMSGRQQKHSGHQALLNVVWQIMQCSDVVFVL